MLYKGGDLSIDQLKELMSPDVGGQCWKQEEQNWSLGQKGKRGIWFLCYTVNA